MLEQKTKLQGCLTSGNGKSQEESINLQKMPNLSIFTLQSPMNTYHSHLTVNRRPVPDTLDVERQSHVISVVLLINLMSDVSPAATSGFLAVALDWLA